MHAADQLPGQALVPEEVVNRRLRFGHLRPKRHVERVPEGLKDGRRQIPPVIGGAAEASASNSLVDGGGMGACSRAAVEVRPGAHCGHVATAELAPIAKHWRQHCPHLRRTELQ